MLVTVPNIGPGQSRRRLVRGLLAAALSVLIAATLVAADAPRAWRALLFPPLWMAGIGVFQARAKT